VTRHYDLTRDIDYVVGVFGCDRLDDSGDLSVPDPDVELAIDVVCGIDHMSVLQHRVELL
jgi:hypothetical protein